VASGAGAVRGCIALQPAKIPAATVSIKTGAPAEQRLVSRHHIMNRSSLAAETDAQVSSSLGHNFRVSRICFELFNAT
jgi:hypothetical protein